jgi:hypothetical protein
MLCAAVLLVSAAGAKTLRITVAAENVDRAAQRVEFKLPPEVPQANLALHGERGRAIPLQVAADGTATFLIPVQKAGEVLTFTSGPAGPGTGQGRGIDVKTVGGQLQVTAGGAPVLHYQMDKEALPRPGIRPEFKRAGYLHPVFTPSGKIVSDDFPAQHVHHHGVWAPWTKTLFQGRDPDFWNMGKKTGTVEFVAVDWTWSGPVHGGFVARHQFVDLSAPGAPVTALHEVWEVTAYDVPGARVFDVLLTQVCATNDPLVLPQYHYGGMGFRGRGEWLGRDKAKFLTSEGETDRVKAHTAKVRWIHIEGAVEGGTAGVALLGHPENFRAPQPLRVHPNEPFICWTPQQGGEFSIVPGKPYVARYRFVAADGPPDRGKLDAYWNGFARPATVRIAPLP